MTHQLVGNFSVMKTLKVLIIFSVAALGEFHVKNTLESLNLKSQKITTVALVIVPAAFVLHGTTQLARHRNEQVVLFHAIRTQLSKKSST